MNHLLYCILSAERLHKNMINHQVKGKLTLYFSLQDKWSSAYDCRTILLSIQSLLGGLWDEYKNFQNLLASTLNILLFSLAEPNIDSPLNSSAAALWNNQEGMSICIIGVTQVYRFKIPDRPQNIQRFDEIKEMRIYHLTLLQCHVYSL